MIWTPSQSRKLKCFSFDGKSFTVVDDKFQLFINDNVLVSKADFDINQPDETYNRKYVGLGSVETLEQFRNNGYCKILLEQIFQYVKTQLKLDTIILHCYMNNHIAMLLYTKLGFETLTTEEYFGDNARYSYKTLIKRLQ